MFNIQNSRFKIQDRSSDFTKPFRERAGFTLVETITTIFVFSVVAVVVAGIWIKAVEIERRAFSAQIIQENALAVLGIMAKEIRVGTITNQDNNCSGSPATTLNLNIYNDAGAVVAVIYRLNNGIVERVYGGTTYQISTNDVTFNRLGFCVLGSATSPYGNDAVRITILASISNNTGQTVTTNLQTSVTSRDVEGDLIN